FGGATAGSRTYNNSRRRGFSQGEGDPFAQFFGRQTYGSIPRQGQDLQYNLTISLEDSVFGAEKKLSLQKEDTVEEINVRIPPGITTGKRLRLPGKGSPGYDGGPNGDLYLNITIAPHPIFSRDGNDLYVEKSISFSQAALGTTIEVPTLDGTRKRIKVPAGTQTNTKIRMKGYGAPGLRGSAKGDQFVKINIDVPRKLTERQIKLIRELADDGL
ncbi:MAG: J domain-containing protein, partial [Smithellaceae bacterium]|nr:J domain-containing protein [Smithellaceae bacterium]